MSRPASAVLALGAVLRNANLRRVELAWGALITAEWAHFVALGVFAYEVGGTVGVGVAGLVRMLPAALAAPFAAFLGDRFRRERFLIAVSLLGSGALAGSAAAFFVAENEVLVFAFAGLVGLASTLVRPALQALLPSLARTSEELIASNGATSTVESLGTLAGPLLAGVLVSVADVGVVFAVAAVAFLAAAVLLSRVIVEGRIHVRAAAGESVRRLLFGGFRIVMRAPKLRLVIGLMAAQAFVRGCLNVLIVVTAFRVLHAGPGAVGYMNAAIGVGGLIGALGALTLKGGRLAIPFGVALVFWGLPIALVAPWKYLAVALILLAVVGAANSVEDVAGFTLLQRIVPDEALTRVLAVLWGLAMGAAALGSIAAPAVVSGIGPRAALVVVGIILPVLTLVTWRQLVEIDRTVAGPSAELALIHGVAIFAPLSLAAKEHLAGKLVPSSVGAGEVVIQAGDVGDRFYIVAAGELEIVANGKHAVANKGDYFGEIALLRDVPRTATVKALADSELFALDRVDFLAGVSGHAGARAAGEAVVEERFAAGARPADSPDSWTST